MPALLILAVLLLLPATAAAADDADCLACHGERTAQSASGRSIHVDARARAGSAHAGLGCADCHTAHATFPHPRKAPKVACADCHDEAAQQVTGSVHGPLEAEACTGCHGDVHTLKALPKGGSEGAECASCHEGAVKALAGSVHARDDAHAGRDGASCRACHGPAHTTRAAQDAQSPAAKRNLPGTCARCHADASFQQRHQLALARPVETWERSVHARALRSGNDKAASCSDCHGSHAIRAAREPDSPVNPRHVVATCGRCHADVRQTYVTSVHGTAAERGVKDAPVCTDCHGEHAILAPDDPQSLVHPTRVVAATCGHCHADERLAARLNLPLDKVPAFRDSFHGLAGRSGSQTVANCASCHGVHNILPSSDPRSTVHVSNLARTCGACHPGAGERFAIGPVHVRPASASEHVVVRWARVFYLWIIPLTVGFMLLHHLLDFVAKLRRPRPRLDPSAELPRMNRHFRRAHLLVVLSFGTLVVTGFALKYPDAGWAAPLLALEGRWAVRGLVHRGAALLMTLALVYHVLHLALVPRHRRVLVELLPRWQDLRDLAGMLRYNLGRQSTRPHFGVFSYVEKVEYWAFMWGTVVMAGTGFLLWFNSWALRHVPTWALDAATVVHFYEAVLATLSIVIWHFYTVVFDPDVYPMDRAWLTGRTSAEHLRHTRPAYHAALVAALEARAQAASEAAEATERSSNPGPAPEEHAPDKP